MLKRSLLLTILVVGCTDPEPFDRALNGETSQLHADESQSDQFTIDPGEYHCEPMTEAARAAAPPPAPVFTAASFVPRAHAVCPPGEVPFYRQPERARSPEGPPPPPDLKHAGGSDISTLAGSYWYAGVMKPTETFNQVGVGALVLITNPTVVDQNDMVTAEMSIVRGSNYHLVEIGLRKFWDAFPRLMISQWAYGQFNDATGFVRVHAVYAPGMPLTAYYGYTVRHYIRYYNGNWWVWFNDGWVGYYPGSIWSGAFTSGEMAHFYGEVYSAQSRIPPLTDMGNGLFSSNGSAAFMQEMCMHGDSACYLLVNGWRNETNATYYSLYYANDSYMRFGGNGGG